MKSCHQNVAESLSSQLAGLKLEMHEQFTRESAEMSGQVAKVAHDIDQFAEAHRALQPLEQHKIDGIIKLRVTERVEAIHSADITEKVTQVLEHVLGGKLGKMT